MTTEQLYNELRDIKSKINEQLILAIGEGFDFVKASEIGGDADDYARLEDEGFDLEEYVPSVYMSDKYDGVEFLLHVYKLKRGYAFGYNETTHKVEWFRLDQSNYLPDLIGLIEKIKGE